MFQGDAGNTWGKHRTALREGLLQEHPQVVKFLERQVGNYPTAVHNALFEAIRGGMSVRAHQAMVDNTAVETSIVLSVHCPVSKIVRFSRQKQSKRARSGRWRQSAAR
jgi:hypothetical protein